MAVHRPVATAVPSILRTAQPTTGNAGQNQCLCMAGPNCSATSTTDFLPASTILKNGTLDQPLELREFIQGDLDVHRLNDVLKWLKWAGRPVPPRPLHHQLFLQRDIVINERLDMHLLWEKGRIFLKPLPKYLLWGDWKAELACEPKCACLGGVPCAEKQTYQSAQGFLLSYAALLSREVDFSIAVEKKLIPPELGWPCWKTLVKDLVNDKSIAKNINNRFIYGELRLYRVHKIFRYTGRAVIRGYHNSHATYGDFLAANFNWLASILVYVALVLTAMQVGLATRALGQNDSFQAVSYGFTVFAIIGPLIAVSVVLLVFLVMFVGNWAWTSQAAKKQQGQRNNADEGHRTRKSQP